MPAGDDALCVCSMLRQQVSGLCYWQSQSLVTRCSSCQPQREALQMYSKCATGAQQRAKAMGWAAGAITTVREMCCATKLQAFGAGCRVGPCRWTSRQPSMALTALHLWMTFTASCLRTQTAGCMPCPLAKSTPSSSRSRQAVVRPTFGSLPGAACKLCCAAVQLQCTGCGPWL